MRYEKYKKSISPFLEEIPFHWKETYLSHAYSLSSDTGHTEEQLLSVFLDKGVVSYSSTDQKQVHKPSEDMSKYQLVNPGDFVINNQQAWRGSVGISRYKGIVSPAYYIWRPREDNNPYYMNYLFRDHYIIDQFVLASKGVGSIQRQVYVPYMKRIILSIPPREEQNQIVRYLDWQVSKINKLIHGYQRQIKLMEERRQTVIDRAVTKGVRQGRQIPEEQILFKSNAKGFVRTYNFLSAILPYGSVEWEKLSIFLKLLIGKLPSPAEDDNISGLLEDIDLESYRAVAQDTMRIQLDNENGELNPIPVSRDVGISVPELDPLTQILKEFHDAFGGIDWTDEDKVKKQVADLPAIVSKDEAYQNAIKNSDAQNARVESDRATMQAILDSMSTTIELYKAVNENPALCKWIQDMVFANTYQTSPPAKEDQPDFD